MSRNEHRRTPLHHAAAMNRPAMVRLLLELGADVAVSDDTGGTALTTAAAAGADASILTMLEQAGARLDLLAAVTLKRYDVAERLLADDPGRIGADGRDTIALHMLVAKKNAGGVKWLIDRRRSDHPRRQVRGHRPRLGGVLRAAAHRRPAAPARDHHVMGYSPLDRRQR